MFNCGQKLFFRAESESYANIKGRRITGRGVDSFADIARRADARLEKVLRFKVVFVQEIINRKIQINPLSQAFGNGEINDIVTGGANRIRFAVQAIA